MKNYRLLFTFLLLLAIVFSCYGVWLQFPSARNTAVVTEAHAVAGDRLKERLARAEDPALNGFLSPTFVPYWGRPSRERVDGSPASKIVEAWSQYATPYGNERVDHQSLQAKADEGYSKALADMETVAPELREAMGKPVFIPPNFEPNSKSEVPNYIAARLCAYAMVALAEAQVAQGKKAQAAQDLVSVVHFGSGFVDHSTLVGDMVGVNIQSIGLHAFNGLIDINTDFSAKEWKSLAKQILDSTSPKDAMLRALQGEIVFCGNSIELLATDSNVLGEGGWTPVLPGTLGREMRIYNNLMSDLIVQFQKDGTVRFPKELDEDRFMDRVAGRSGSLAKTLIPNCERSNELFNISRLSLTATATAAGVAAYRIQEGRLPERLTKLAEAGIPLTEDKELFQAMDYQVNGDAATLKVQIQDPQATPALDWDDKWEHAWLQAGNGSLTFKFGPVKSRK